MQDVLGCCFEGASERKKARARRGGRAGRLELTRHPAARQVDSEAPGAAPGATGLTAQLNAALDALAEEWGSALPLVQVRPGWR